MAENITAASLECDNFYQISDDDLDDCEDLPDDCLLEEVDGPNTSNSLNYQSRGPYERAWTTDATRALIHIRGPMESRFSEGRQKRTALWLHCTRQLQKMGFRYSAAKVQKKWHNILITYNKNLGKKYTAGYVHWEFFEDMFKYLQGKKADFDTSSNNSTMKRIKQNAVPNPANTFANATASAPTIQYVNANSMDRAANNLLHQQIELDSGKSNDDYDEEDSNSMHGLNKLQMDIKQEDDEDQLVGGGGGETKPQAPIMPAATSSLAIQQNHKAIKTEFPKNFSKSSAMLKSAAPTYEVNSNATDLWWQDYFERKLQVERDKIELQKEMHRDLMQFNKMSLLQQEKIERIKIEAINSLTNTLQKLVEVKYKKQ